jgi:hypothetical protein
MDIFTEGVVVKKYTVEERNSTGQHCDQDLEVQKAL